MLGGREAHADEYPSAAFLYKPADTAEEDVSETGVIIDDYLVLTAAHVVKHLRDYRLENSILVNPQGETPMFVVQGNIPIDVPLEQALLGLTDTNRIRFVSHVVFAEGFEEVAPNVYKNDLAIIVTAGYAGTYSDRTEPVFDPFPPEWQADVTGPIQWATSVDPNDNFDCRVDLVTYGPGPNLEVSGEKRVGSMCQAWGQVREMEHYLEVMQPYFEAAYAIAVPNREISLQAYIDLSMQPGLDSGPLTEYVSASSAFHTNSLASNAPPPAHPCEGDSGGGLYLRGTNFLTGIFTSGSAQNICGDPFFQQVIFFRGARLTAYNSWIKSMRDATRDP